MCLEEFKNCWLKAKDPYDKAMDLYSSNIKRAEDLRKTIENNKHNVKGEKLWSKGQRSRGQIKIDIVRAIDYN